MDLKPSHEVFAQALIVGKGNLTSAYSEAYPGAKYASCRQGGWLLSKNVNIHRRLRELLEQNDLGLDKCLKKLNALTLAKKVQTYGRGQSGYFEDHAVRLQAIQTALKIHVLLGDFQPVDEADGADI